MRLITHGRQKMAGLGGGDVALSFPVKRLEGFLEVPVRAPLLDARHLVEDRQELFERILLFSCHIVNIVIKVEYLLESCQYFR